MDAAAAGLENVEMQSSKAPTGAVQPPTRYHVHIIVMSVVTKDVNLVYIMVVQEVVCEENVCSSVAVRSLQ